MTSAQRVSECLHSGGIRETVDWPCSPTWALLRQRTLSQMQVADLFNGVGHIPCPSCASIVAEGEAPVAPARTVCT
jgi:hypothetical protein